MANYLSLEEAATKLGISADRLSDLRSRGEVRGFRDGASWKFPETEVDRLHDELSVGGELVDSGLGSDLGVGAENVGDGSGGSDVNLVPGADGGSDVKVVTNESDLGLDDNLAEIDSAELQLDEPAITHESSQLNLADDPNAGSTGPVTDKELKEISEAHPDVLSDDEPVAPGDLKLRKPDDAGDSGFTVDVEEEDSGEVVIGADEEDEIDMIGDKIKSEAASAGLRTSSLELMDDLGDQTDDPAAAGSQGVDVLSELDLLSAEQQGSGLISGDSEDLLASSGGISASGLSADDDLSGINSNDDDDALDDDDDLVISDDDDDLVISSAGSDISVAGDSGINLMSPSDSGLSLESEPLDLAGSSVSALDLGAELADGSGSGRGSDGSGSAVDFAADEDFQLSPSGVGLDADIESNSQVIEVEESSEGVAVVDEADPFGGDVAVEDDGFGADDADAIAIDDSAEPAIAGAPVRAAYEVPFTIWQCSALVCALLMLGIGGILMTDLIRNIWTYSEPATPVSSLTDWLCDLIS